MITESNQAIPYNVIYIHFLIISYSNNVTHMIKKKKKKKKKKELSLVLILYTD